MDYGQEEAEAIQGQDPREYLVSSSRFAGDADGNVKAVHIHNIEWTNDNGRFIPKKVEGSERVLEADLVLLAMGFLGPEATIAEELGLDLDARSNVQAEYGKFKPASKASSPPATCAAVSPSSSGRSTKAAPSPASATSS